MKPRIETFMDKKRADYFYSKLVSNPVDYSVEPVRLVEYTTAIGETLRYFEVVYRTWKGQ